MLCKKMKHNLRIEHEIRLPGDFDKQVLNDSELQSNSAFLYDIYFHDYIMTKFLFRLGKLCQRKFRKTNSVDKAKSVLKVRGQ